MKDLHDDKISVAVIDRHGLRETISVNAGMRLREALILNNLSPYDGPNKHLNCKGLGICGSCKVYVCENGEEWEKRSCQIQCFQEMEIRLK